MGLPTHIESYIGKISYGWSADDKSAGVQVIKVANAPKNGVTTYSTLGMSGSELDMPRGRKVRQELMFSTFDRYEASNVASFLLTFGDSVLTKHRALLRGDVVGPEGPLIPGVTANAIYCTMPVMFDSRLATYIDTEPPTVFVWLIPITSVEACYIKRNGWNRFEEILEKGDALLWDLSRPSLPEVFEL